MLLARKVNVPSQESECTKPGKCMYQARKVSVPSQRKVNGPARKVNVPSQESECTKPGK